MNYNVMGFGGVKFELSVFEATFALSFGEVTFEPVFDSVQNGNKKIFRRFEGYRPVVDVNLYNIQDDDYKQMRGLITIVNLSNRSNTGITIYPEYSVDNDTNLSLSGMFLDSDFMLEDLVRREGLQAVKLSFTADTLIQNIPNWTNATAEYIVTDDDYEIVTDGGDSLITNG